MNGREQEIFELLSGGGFEVYRRGWPDLLVFDPRTEQGLGVELKPGVFPDDEHLSFEQRRLHRRLRKLGVPTLVVGYSSPLIEHWLRDGLPENVLPASVG